MNRYFASCEFVNFRIICVIIFISNTCISRICREISPTIIFVSVENDALFNNGLDVPIIDFTGENWHEIVLVTDGATTINILGAHFEPHFSNFRHRNYIEIEHKIDVRKSIKEINSDFKDENLDDFGDNFDKINACRRLIETIENAINFYVSENSTSKSKDFRSEIRKVMIENVIVKKGDFVSENNSKN